LPYFTPTTYRSLDKEYEEKKPNLPPFTFDLFIWGQMYQHTVLKNQQKIQKKKNSQDLVD
jgi:hypothetical protein